MNTHQRDILFRGLEPWDKDKTYHSTLEASLAYLLAIRVMLFEQQEMMRDRVSIIYFIILLLVD